MSNTKTSAAGEPQALLEQLTGLANYLAQGGTLHAMLGIDLSHLDRLYAYAGQLFEQGNYAGAKNYYLLLSRLCHWQYDYWLALGLTCQRLGESAEAAYSFGRAGLLRLDDPLPPYYAALSHRLDGDTELAQKAMVAAIKRCAHKAEYAALKRELQAALAQPQE